MELIATDFDAGDNGEFTHVGFYDNDAMYGVGFSRLHDEKRIELMVADQSVYDLENAKIAFYPTKFTLHLQNGTINEIDGEDNYNNL